MYQYIQILGEKIPTYFICACVGLIITIVCLSILLLERLIFRKYIKLLIFSLIGLLLCARFFGILSKMLYDYYIDGIIDIKGTIKNSGIVFFGGLFGYIGMLNILCHYSRKDFKEIANIVAICIPLFHVFGRIGCYFGGCCYGVISSSFFSIPYRACIDTEKINRIPVQLFEAVYELIICCLFIYLYRNKLKNNKASDGKLLFLYMILYSIFRFLIEFWRGDDLRGVFGLFSFSQIVCIIIIFILIIFKIKNFKFIKLV